MTKKPELNAIEAFILIEGRRITEDPPTETIVRKGRTDRGWFYHLRAPMLEWLGDLTIEWCTSLSVITITMIVMKVLKAAQEDTLPVRGFAFTVPAVEIKRWAQGLVSDPKVAEAYLVTGTYDFIVFGDALETNDFPPPVLSFQAEDPQK